MNDNQPTAGVLLLKHKDPLNCHQIIVILFVIIIIIFSTAGVGAKLKAAGMKGFLYLFVWTGVVYLTAQVH